MSCFSILAQAADRAAAESVVPVEPVWQYVTSLNFLEALTFISFGVVCLLYGWRVFKILVVISFGLLGLALGIVVGERIQGSNSQLWGGLIGLGLLATLSVPLMKWAVGVLGAVSGGLITSGLWYAFGLNEKYIWAGALIGLIAGGMISFIIFRIAVMLFSSLGGSMLMVTGLLALLYLCPQTDDGIRRLVFQHNWFLPVALMVPTAVGLIVQNKFIRHSKEWSV
ncbi:MAG: hypothetical protein ACYTBJ_13785 [Planctomycetota bacterium]|jgi:hypothetical protein